MNACGYTSPVKKNLQKNECSQQQYYLVHIPSLLNLGGAGLRWWSELVTAMPASLRYQRTRQRAMPNMDTLASH